MTIGVTEDNFETSVLTVNSVWIVKEGLLFTPDVTSSVTLGVTRDVTLMIVLDVTVPVTLIPARDDPLFCVDSTLDKGNVETSGVIELVTMDGVILTDESMTRIGVTLLVIEVLRVTVLLL